MIIACTSCPAQYSVPDAKVRGKKVRVTCKHCGTGIIVDGMALGLGAPPEAMSLPEPMPVAPRVLPSFDVPKAVGADDDATRIMRRPTDDYSVHEEPTVIGQIPREALEAERRFALRTEPPKPGPTDAPQAGMPLPTPVVPSPATALPQVPERAIDVTAMASPKALRASTPSLPPQPSAEVQTMLSSGTPQFRPRKWRWLGVALLLVILVLVSQTLRYLR